MTLVLIDLGICSGRNYDTMHVKSTFVPRLFKENCILNHNGFVKGALLN